MMKDIIGSRAFLDSLYEQSVPVDIDQLFEDVRTTYDLAHIVYHATNVKGLTENGPYLRLTYSDVWVNRYTIKNYFAIDPVIEAGIRNYAPFNWDILDWTGKARRDFLGDSAKHKVGPSGMSVPIRGVNGQHAILSVTSFQAPDTWNKFLRSYIGDFQMLAQYIHQAIIQAEGVDSKEQITPLSIRERDVLTLCARGETTDEIAGQLGVKERTIRAYIESARDKLNAKNRIHAVAKAIGRGLILPP